MSEVGKKSYHFNSNIRSNHGSKASMSNNEDRYLRALEIQEAKQVLIDEKLEKQRLIDEAEKAAADEKARQEAEAKAAQAKEEAANAPVEETVIEEAAEEAAPAAAAAPASTKPAPSGNNVPGPTPRNDFSSAERAAMLKRAKAHAAEVAKRKG